MDKENNISFIARSYFTQRTIRMIKAARKYNNEESNSKIRNIPKTTENRISLNADGEPQFLKINSPGNKDEINLFHSDGESQFSDKDSRTNAVETNINNADLESQFSKIDCPSKADEINLLNTCSESQVLDTDSPSNAANINLFTADGESQYLEIDSPSNAAKININNTDIESQFLEINSPSDVDKININNADAESQYLEINSPSNVDEININNTDIESQFLEINSPSNVDEININNTDIESQFLEINSTSAVDEVNINNADVESQYLEINSSSNVDEININNADVESQYSEIDSLSNADEINLFNLSSEFSDIDSPNNITEIDLNNVEGQPKYLTIESPSNEVENEYCAEDIVSPVNSSRKRQRMPETWSRNIKKKKVNMGEAYKTKSGREVSKKTMKSGCNNKCRLKCAERFTFSERKKIFDDFRHLSNVDRKRDMVSKLIEEVKPKYSYKKHDSNRSSNISFHFFQDGVKYRICKKMFCDTLCISSTFITTVIKKTSPSGKVQEDLRGKHEKPRIHTAIIDNIKAHINSFARIESHYCRASTKREYIDGNLNISEMYRLYIEDCQIKEIPTAKKHKYEEIFNTHFNIGFFTPKKDKCSLCHTFENSSDAEKQLMKEQMEHHHNEKDLIRKEKQQDKLMSLEANSELIVAMYDLQAVIQLPRGQVSTFYYKRKLKTFNFTIYDATAKQGHCYIWHEGCAKRGANEIASFVFDFLKKECCGKDVIFYSDNCAGQNKNKFLVAMYLYAVQVFDIKSITHKYLVVGHTQNEGDSMHSVLERAISVSTKKQPLYLPSQYVAIAQSAVREKNPYHVQLVDTGDVYDWQQVICDIGKNFAKSTCNNKIKWKLIRALKVQKNTPGSVFYKYSVSDDTMMEFQVQNRHTRGIRVLRPLKAAYEKPPGISAAKKADLLQLCSDKHIPTSYHPFFKELLVTTMINNEDSESE